MLIERERRLSNWRVLYVGGVEACKEKEWGKGEVNDNTVSEGDKQQPMLLQGLLEEGGTKEDQELDKQEGDE